LAGQLRKKAVWAGPVGAGRKELHDLGQEVHLLVP
jgi:hypothetical protein